MRSAWKGVFQHFSLLKVGPVEGSQVADVFSRASWVTLNWVGATFLVYNGKSWEEVVITPAHADHRLGEFARTRAFFVPKVKKKKQNKKKKQKKVQVKKTKGKKK